MNPFVTSKKTALLFFALIILFFVSVPISHAQTNALTINVLPQYPGPFENVSVSVEDYSRDLNKVDVSWSANGKILQHGTGLKQIQINTGALGTVTNLSINMGGEVQQVSIRPSAVDLLWQADTYISPFYKGKALHTDQDPITVVAIPFFVDSKGARLNPENLTYTWTENGEVNASASGFGKSTFKIVPTILPKSITVGVEVASSDNVYHSMSAVSIPVSRPVVTFYENQPLYGIDFAHALNDTNFEITMSEAKIVAMPYFFSNQQEKNDLLSHNWALNSQPLNEAGNEVILRKPDDTTSGQSSISLNVKNLQRFMQSGSAGFTAVFNGSQSANQTSQTVF